MKKTTLETAQELHRAGLLDDAKAVYLKLLSKKPKNPGILHALGIIATQQQNFSKGIEYLQQALQYQPHDPSLQLHLANVLKLQGLFNQAIQLLQKTIQEHPDYLPAYNNIGTILYDLGKLDEALFYFRLVVAKKPDYADAYYNLGLALTKTNRLSEAIEAYQALLSKHPENFAARFHLACTFMQNNQINDAIQEFTSIAQPYPNHLETQMNLAACYLKKGDLNQAKLHYLRATELAPEDMQIHFNLGVINMQQGNIEDAIQHYQMIVRKNPDHFAAHNNLGVAFMTKRNLGMATQHFQEAFRLQPNNISIQHILKVISQKQHLLTSPPEYISSLFDAYADHYESHLTHALAYKVPEIMFNAIKPATLLNDSLTVLDIGCGTGLCGVMIKPFSKKLIGIDLSSKMLAVAQQKNIYDELMMGDFHHYLSNQVDQFDLIIAGDVLVYIGDLKETFKKIYHALKLNGLFVFNTEMTDQSDFLMNTSGRFSHRKNYIEQLATENHFMIHSYETAVTRQQNNEPVLGHIFVLKKS